MIPLVHRGKSRVQTNGERARLEDNLRRTPIRPGNIEMSTQETLNGYLVEYVDPLAAKCGYAVGLNISPNPVNDTVVFRESFRTSGGERVRLGNAHLFLAVMGPGLTTNHFDKILLGRPGFIGTGEPPNPLTLQPTPKDVPCLIVGGRIFPVPRFLFVDPPTATCNP